MAKVLAIQENINLDYSDAERYGEIYFGTQFEYSPIKNSARNGVLLKDIDKAVALFNPEEDYLLLTGNPLVIGYCVHELMKKSPELRVLRYSRNDRRYTEMVFNPTHAKALA